MLEVNVDSLDFNTIQITDETKQVETFNLKKELAVNEHNLLVEMLAQPTKYVYWSSVLEKLKYYQEALELELEFQVATLDKQARDEMKQIAEKPTKDSVDAYIKRHPDYQAKRQECLNYDYVIGRVQRIVKAFEQRKDMLQSYGKQVLENQLYGKGAGTTPIQTPQQPPQHPYWGGYQQPQ
ncbi:hypothetical protein [Bacillus phage BC-T25]|nr:hypothetical protein [Bacillus phage BC-T25]